MPSNFFVRFFFGTDVFISYRWNERAKAYALKLADHLEKRGLDCYIDEIGLARGEVVPNSLRSAIRQSKMFVLLATDDLMESSWVPREIAIAKEKGRKIIPVNVEGAIDKLPLGEPPWDALKDRSRVEEGESALQQGEPSKHVAEQIDQSYNFTRKRVTAIRVLFLVGSIFFGLSVAAGSSGLWAVRVRRQAREETRQLNEQANRLKAEISKVEIDKQTAVKQKQDAEGNRDKAIGERDSAQAEAIEAAGERDKAESESRIAKNEKSIAEVDREKARLEAGKQSQIALSLRLANQAETVKTQGYGFLGRSVLLAGEAVSRLLTLDTYSSDADNVLRSGLDLLPRLVAVVQGSKGIGPELTLSPDGSYLVTWDHTNAQPSVWSTSTGKFIGHIGEPRQFTSLLAFGPAGSRAGHYALSMSDDTAVTVWNLEDGSTVKKLKHEGGVTAANFSADGLHVITAGKDNAARVWGVDDWGQEAYLKHDSPVINAVFSAKGQFIATLCRDGSLNVWANAGASGWKAEKRYEGYSGATYLLFSPGEDGVVTASTAVVRLLEWRTGEEVANFKTTRANILSGLITGVDETSLFIAGRSVIYELSLLDGSVSSFSYTSDTVNDSPYISPDGRYLGITMFYSPAVRLLDMRTRRDAAVMIHPSKEYVTKDPADSLNFVQGMAVGGRYIASQLDNGNVYIWENPGYLSDQRLKHRHAVTEVFFTPSGNAVGTLANDGTANLWEARTGQAISRVKYADNQFRKASLSSKGSYIAAARGDGSWLLDGRTGEAKTKLSSLTEEGFIFSPDEELVASSKGKTIRVWRTSDGLEVKELKHENLGEIKHIAFSPNSQYLVTGGIDGTAVVWRRSDFRLLTAKKNEGEVSAIAFSPNNQLVATASKIESFTLIGGTSMVRAQYSPTRVYVWNITSGEQVIPPVTHGDNPSVIALSDMFLACANERGVIKIVRLTDGTEVALMRQERQPNVITFSPTGNYMATGSDDRLAMVWETKSWQQVVRLNHDERVFTVAFSEDDRYFATGAADGIARIWLLRPVDLVRETCARLGRNFEGEEWGTFLGSEQKCVSCELCRICPNLPKPEGCSVEQVRK